MKKILFTIAALLLVATPALAMECDPGYEWQENIAYENGQCLTEETTYVGGFSFPTLTGQWGCENVWGGTWFGGSCHLGGSLVTQCTEYEQVEVDNGMCVAIEEEPSEEPSENGVYGCTDPDSVWYDSAATVDDGSCDKVVGSNVYFNMPRINRVDYQLVGNELTVNVLTGKKMSCDLLVDTESHLYPLDPFQKPVGSDGWSVLSGVGLENNFGYEGILAGTPEGQTYHSMFVVLTEGIHYVRPICSYYGMPFLGNEITVEVE